MEKLLYHLWLTLLLGVKNIELDLLLNAFDSAADVYNAARNELREVEGLKSDTVEIILKNKSLEKAREELTECRRLGIKLIPSYSEKFPIRLLNIYCPPHILYVKGDIGNIDEELCIAVIGTRDCSEYGVTVGKALGQDLASYGVTVVSGGARGIDTASLSGASDALGRTIAVLGCGVDVVYPPENRRLFKNIEENGALISEYPLHLKPLPHHFPQRNRIISGLCQGVVVLEAPKRSGSLITARYALEQGRDVYAVPGNITSPLSAGSNALIKAGAYPVTNARDIMSQYKYFVPVMYENLKNRFEEERVLEEDIITPRKTAKSLSKEQVKKSLSYSEPKNINDIDFDKYDGLQREVLKLLAKQDMNTDELLSRLNISAGDLNSTLITLEMMNVIIKKLDKRYSII